MPSTRRPSRFGRWARRAGVALLAASALVLHRAYRPPSRPVNPPVAARPSALSRPSTPVVSSSSQSHTPSITSPPIRRVHATREPKLPTKWKRKLDRMFRGYKIERSNGKISILSARAYTRIPYTSKKNWLDQVNSDDAIFFRKRSWSGNRGIGPLQLAVIQKTADSFAFSQRTVYLENVTTPDRFDELFVVEAIVRPQF